MDAKTALTFAAGAAAGLALAHVMRPCAGREVASDPNQPRRFAAQQAANCTRALDIDAHFEPALLKGKRVVVTGANRGLGLALVHELVKCGAVVIGVCRKTSEELSAAGVAQIIEGIDVTQDSTMAKLASDLGATGPVHCLVNNAGYFMRERESVVGKTMDFGEELKQIDICAVGILRTTDALFGAGLLPQGSKVAMITSQGGSIAWRDTQCPEGGDYGHHMSKAAANMAGKLVANELRGSGVAVGILHPGFNRTQMTAKYSHIWDIEGAVESAVGAKRVLHEINELSMDTTGRFTNCEDGMLIPW